MIMHNDPSGGLSSCDLFVDSPMVKQESDLHYYHHQQPRQRHSDSSESPSMCSSSLSPKNSSTTAAIPTTTATLPSGTGTNSLTEIDPQLAKHVEYELGLTKKNGSGTRKNAWGNLSYAELISKAITTSAEQRLTLSEIYDWMIKYVPFFRNKVDRASSAGWKNSIRHNLSLHSRFKRIQSEGTGKSSWWIINPDEKNTPSNISNGTTSATNGTKQTRGRLSQNLKTTSTTPKRLRRTTRSTLKSSQTSTTADRQQESTTQKNPPTDILPAPIYDTQSWTTHLDTDTPVNHLYEQDLYASSVHTPIANNTSTGGLQSAYLFDDISANYVSNTSTLTNMSDYPYHHQQRSQQSQPPPPPPQQQQQQQQQQQHFHHPHHHHPPHTLYQHHGSNYEVNSNNGYYHQQPVLNDHHLLPMETYHSSNGLAYSIQPQQQPQNDPNDDQNVYIRAHSASSHSSSSSLSPPMLPANNNLASTSSSSSNYSYPSKANTSLSNGYLHASANGTLTLYSHHHQHHSDVETMVHLSGIDEDVDDDDDFTTLVHHHHGMIDEPQQLSSFLGPHSSQSFSNNESSTSILRTVLNRPVVDMHNQHV